MINWSPLHTLALISPSHPSGCGSRLPWLSLPSRSGTLHWRLCSFFLLANAALAYLPTALTVALGPLFPFQQAQYAQVFLLKPAPFCKLFAGLGSTSKSATSLLFLSDPRSVLSSISPFTSLSGRSGRNCLLSPSVLSDYSGSLDTRFSWGTTRLMSWPDGQHYLHPLQFLVVSLLLSLISTLVFSRTGGVLSYRNSLTHKSPRLPPRNLCSLVTLAMFSLVFAATDTAFC